MLCVDDPLPERPRRVLVAGTAGSGKSTLARRISAALDLPYQEIDALHHGPNWVPRAEFSADVHAFTDQAAWVTEWQYCPVRPVLLERADTIVFLLFPRRIVMWRVVRRTVRRRLRRLELWNGNTEGPLWRFFTDEDHIIRWAWRTHAENSRRYDRIRSGQEAKRLTIVHLHSPAEVDGWVDGTLRACSQCRGDK